MKSVRLVGEVLLDDRRRAYRATIGEDGVTEGSGPFRGVDLVDVALGAKGCLDVCRDAIAAGARVVAHGPAPSELRGFAELLERSSSNVRLAHPIRFDNKYMLPAEELGDGKLGEVITVRIIRTGSNERDLTIEDLNVLDAMLLLGGPVLRILSRRQHVKAREHDSALCVVRFANRAIGYGEACTAYPKGYFYEVIEVVTRDAMLEYDSFSRVNRVMGKDGIALVDSYHVPPYQAMVEDYVADFDGVDMSKVPQSESLALLRLAQAALRSAGAPEAVTL